MQSLKKILDEMGFNKDAPIEAQKAFVKHLISAANQTRPTSVYSRPAQKTPTTQSQSKPTASQTSVDVGTQLEFDFKEDKRVS